MVAYLLDVEVCCDGALSKGGGEVRLRRKREKRGLKGGKKGKMGEWKQQSAIPCLSVVFNSHASLGWELPFICRLQSLFLLNPLESSLDYMKRPRQLL
jgi:hypothetical protein